MLPRLKPVLQPRTLTQKVHAILRKYGADAHVYLPGIGSVSGIDAGNWLESTGNTPIVLDNPVGLALDAEGSLGPELIINPFTAGDAGALVSNVAGVVTVTNNDATAAYTAQNAAAIIGKTYRLRYTLDAKPASSVARIIFGGYDSGATISPGIYTRHIVASGVGGLLLTNGASTAIGEYSVWSNISVKEVSGIHASQPTTANKPILRNASNRYYWDFVDATDVLNATFPAGYESVTTIDAAPGGQVTLTAQNIVGTYAITTDTYGRFIFKTITAEELVVMQKFANRLAGL